MGNAGRWTWALGLCAGVVACSAAAPPEPPPAPPPPPADEVAAVPVAHTFASVVGTWRAQNRDGSWLRTYRFRSDGSYTASGRPAWEEAGKVRAVDGSTQTLSLLFDHRTYDGRPDEPVERRLTIHGDGASFELGGDTYVRVEDVVSVAMEDDPTVAP